MSLAERSRRSGIGASPGRDEPGSVSRGEPGHGSASQASAPGVDPAETPRSTQVLTVKHCWVVDAPMSPGRWPGLLLGWRRQPGQQWQGLASWVVQDADGPVVLQAWVAAEHLHAAD